MSHTRIFDVLKTDWTGPRYLVFVCTLLMAFAAVPLHAGQLAYKDVYDFPCSTGGYNPYNYGQLTQGSDGYLYGTAHLGGSSGLGTVFKVSPDGSTCADIVQFDNAAGIFPFGGLTLASDGYFYGTTNEGGDFGFGTLFRTTNSGGITVLHSFNGTDGKYPLVPPVQAKDGNLYGVTGSGSTYRFNLASATFQHLPNSAPGDTTGPLVLAGNGNLYGTTRTGGDPGAGTVFSMSGAAIKIIYGFNGTTKGANPEGPVVQGADGSLYGVTNSGGANSTGTIFKLTLSGKMTVLHNFAAFSTYPLNPDGAQPYAGLFLAPDKNLYGVTSVGGNSGYGTIFKISTGGSFTKIFDFTGAAGLVPGDYPTTTLMEDTNGCFYGLTTGGVSPNATTGNGNVYSLCPQSIIQIVKVDGPIFVLPGVPVQILGENLTGVFSVSFGGVQAQFQPGSDTYLIATVPPGAVDGLVTVTLATGQQLQSQSAMHILPMITNLDPSSGPVGTNVAIVGGGFVGATRVTFGGVKATSFTIVTPGLIRAIVPTGAKTGKVSVTTHNGTAISKETFTVN